MYLFRNITITNIIAWIFFVLMLLFLQHIVYSNMLGLDSATAFYTITIFFSFAMLIVNLVRYIERKKISSVVFSVIHAALLITLIHYLVIS